MLKQRLQQKLLQKLSPQQIQMIKLLEVPTLQIEQRIKKELEENPALEEGAEEEEIPSETEEDQFEEKDKDQEEFTIDDYIEEDDIPDYRLQAKNYSKDEEKRTEYLFQLDFHFMSISNHSWVSGILLISRKSLESTSLGISMKMDI